MSILEWYEMDDLWDELGKIVDRIIADAREEGYHVGLAKGLRIEEWVECADYLEDEIAKLQERHPENCKCFNCYIGYGLNEGKK